MIINMRELIITYPWMKVFAMYDLKSFREAAQQGLIERLVLRHDPEGWSLIGTVGRLQSEHVELRTQRGARRYWKSLDPLVAELARWSLPGHVEIHVSPAFSLRYDSSQVAG